MVAFTGTRHGNSNAGQRFAPLPSSYFTNLGYGMKA
jgi:hypothetical protein